MRLARAIIRLWSKAVGHSHLVGDNQMVGMSIRVGIKIFSIVGGLSFVNDLNRGFGQWLQVGRVRR